MILTNVLKNKRWLALSPIFFLLIAFRATIIKLASANVTDLLSCLEPFWTMYETILWLFSIVFRKKAALVLVSNLISLQYFCVIHFLLLLQKLNDCSNHFTYQFFICTLLSFS